MKTKLHCAVLALVHNSLQQFGGAERLSKRCPKCGRTEQVLQAVHEHGHGVEGIVTSALAKIKTLDDVDGAINLAIEEAGKHIAGYWCARCHYAYDHPMDRDFCPDDTFENWLEMHPGKTYDDFLLSPEGRP